MDQINSSLPHVASYGEHWPPPFVQLTLFTRKTKSLPRRSKVSRRAPPVCELPPGSLQCGKTKGVEPKKISFSTLTKVNFSLFQSLDQKISISFTRNQYFRYQKPETNSNLQTSPPSETQGKISSVFCTLQDADGTNPDFLLIFIGIFEGSNVAMVVVDTFSRPGKGAKTSSDESSQGTGWFSMFSVAAYKPYFDVDTTNVLERTEDSLFPFRRSFNEKTTNNPDFLLVCINSKYKYNCKDNFYDEKIRDN
ncbi:protein YIPF1 isoform X1 [Carex littledalei]|uniref:Protein YIPF1 isoform X1 n=1 Tax=Carex littledalei TaxID=544730 RepID=A0A833R1M4_9POAL|nr:protein YIPF1 isoform X1 [Carex littledalei]